MKTVTVEWLDSHVESEWRPSHDIRRRAEFEDALRNFTVGYLLLDEDGYVLVASTQTPSSEHEPALYGNTTQIPRSAVISVRELKTGRTLYRAA